MIKAKALRLSLLILSTVVIFFDVRGQADVASSKHWVDSVIIVLETNQLLNAQTKSDLADSAFRVAVREKSLCRQIELRIKQATYLDNMGLSDSALVQLYWANRFFDRPCDSLLLMSLFRNLTNVFLSLGEFSRVDSVSHLAIKLWNPKWNPKDSRLAILNNLGIAYAQKEDTTRATSILHQAYQEAKNDQNQKYILIGLNNLGTLKGMYADLDSAFYFLNEAAIQAHSHQDPDNLMSLLINLATLDRERGRIQHALVLLDSAYVLADTLNSLEKMAKILQTRATLFAETHNFKKAYESFLTYDTIQGKFLDEERVKAVTEMMEKYESEKKAREIQQLKIENLDAELKNERITKTRNHFIYIGSGILLIALGLWWRLTFVHKSRKAIQHEKDISEGLLLNILPASVAEELKIKGKAEAKHFPLATILFSDFKSFTTISESLSAEELVSELNECFKAFDDIITRHGLEKIKTIGDAYMAAAAVPDTNAATAKEVVLAGIEMQRFITSRKVERDQQNKVGFEMRVGIHSGPVVAGIVGVKKFQYDVWGDTVNIANRMETNSEVGRVNISEATFELIRNEPGFQFIPRGMVHAKGKGEMAMYFVEPAA
jgi:adenylate cyclase